MSGNRIKILVVSNTPWRMDNSFGNTFNAFFSGMDDIEIANVYCRAGKPDASAPISRAFQITEKGLLDNLKNRLVPSGTEVLERDDSAPVESAAFNAARKMRCQILFWGRDLTLICCFYPCTIQTISATSIIGRFNIVERQHSPTSPMISTR